MRKPQKQKNRYSMGACVGYMLSMAWRHNKSVIFSVLALAAMSVSLSVTELYAAPRILQKVTDQAPLGELLGTIAVFTLALFLLRALKSYTEDANFLERVDLRTWIICDLVKKVFTTAYPNTLDPAAIKAMDGAMNANGSNRSGTEHVWLTLTTLLTDVAGFLIYLLLLTKVSPWILMVILTSSVAGFYVNKKVRDWDFRHKEEEQKMWTQENSLEKRSQSVELAKDIRIFGLAPWLREIYDGIMRSHQALVERRHRGYFWASLTDVALSLLRSGVAYAYLITMVLQGSITAAEFLLYFSAVSGFTAWVTSILSEFVTLNEECLSISQVMTYLNWPEPFRFTGGKPIPQGDAWELKLEDVSFRYPGTDKNLFEHLNLTIHPGEKLAVVGLNGAGKTTLVKLLAGFYDPDEGRVLLNGQDIREFNRRDYYGLLSAVYQEFSILDATVADNVAQGENPDEEKIWNCLEKAGLKSFIEGLPQKLQTHVGRDVYLDGTLFSGGQTQRLMLARALYKDGPILILDEPTAALDPIAESDIYTKYSDMTAGKTSLFISHRLASTRFCDRIIFLADGKIAEEGTHEELLSLGGEYAKLFQVQSRYYQEGDAQNGKEN